VSGRNGTAAFSTVRRGAWDRSKRRVSALGSGQGRGKRVRLFNGLERQTSVTDARSNTSLTHYNSLGQVDWTQDGPNNQTSYAYYPATGWLGRTGRGCWLTV
jgi:hypothetical protein